MTSMVMSGPGPVYPDPIPPEDWFPPSYTDESGVHRIQVSVEQIRPPAHLGELVHARVHDDQGSNISGRDRCVISAPVNDPSLSLLCTDVETWGDRTSGRLSVLNRRFRTIEDGKVTGNYAPREPVTLGDTLTFNCDGLMADFEPSTIGDGGSTDLLDGAGHFPGEGTYGSLGWVWTGDPGDIEFVEGVRAGTRGLRIRGDIVDGDVLYITKIVRVDETTGYNNLVRSRAFMRVAPGSKPGRLMASIEVSRSATLDGTAFATYWPEAGDGNDAAALSDEDTPSDDWSMNPVTAVGVLPAGPYKIKIKAQWFPQSQTAWTWISEAELIQRDNLSSAGEVDLTVHQKIVVEDAQDETKGKTSLGIPVALGSPCGIEEKLTLWREDNTPRMSVLDGIAGRYGGPDPVWIDLLGRARCQARRGTVRDDLTVSVEHGNLVRVDNWQVNPGGQVSQVRGLMDVGSSYWREVSTATDTSETDGLIRERVTEVPEGLGLRQADEWVRGDLASRSQAQETGTLWVPITFGWTVSVGDTFRVVWVQGGRPFGVRMDRTVRVTDRAFHPSLRLCALQVGTDDLDTRKPALPAGWQRQMGRDTHAIGAGLANTVGRLMRRRVPTPKKYRPPPITSYHFEDTWVGGPTGAFTQAVGEGLWMVNASAQTGPADVMGDLYTGGIVRVTIDTTSDGLRADITDLTGVDQGIATLSRTVKGPTLITVTPNVSAPETPTDSSATADIYRITPSTSEGPS